MRQSALNGTITLAPGSQASIFDCYSNVPGGGPGEYADIHMGGNGSLALRNYSGGLRVGDFAGGAAVSLDFLSGRCIVEDTVTAGDIYIRGTCDVTDDSTGSATIHDQTLNQKIDDTPQNVWDKDEDEVTTPNSMGRKVKKISNDTGLIPGQM